MPEQSFKNVSLESIIVPFKTFVIAGDNLADTLVPFVAGESVKLYGVHARCDSSVLLRLYDVAGNELNIDLIGGVGVFMNMSNLPMEFGVGLNLIGLGDSFASNIYVVIWHTQD